MQNVNIKDCARARTRVWLRIYYSPRILGIGLNKFLLAQANTTEYGRPPHTPILRDIYRGIIVVKYECNGYCQE